MAGWVEEIKNPTGAHRLARQEKCMDERLSSSLGKGISLAPGHQRETELLNDLLPKISMKQSRRHKAFQQRRNQAKTRKIDFA